MINLEMQLSPVKLSQFNALAITGAIRGSSREKLPGIRTRVPT